MKKLFASVLVLALSACASITGPGNQTVVLKSNPAGAEVYVDGVRKITPDTVVLKGSSGYPVQIKKNGYEDVYTKINGEPRVMAAIVGNIFNLTGIVGMAVDFFATGAAYDLDDSVEVNLQPKR